jgi:hypothetical protein
MLEKSRTIYRNNRFLFANQTHWICRSKPYWSQFKIELLPTSLWWYQRFIFKRKLSQIRGYLPKHFHLTLMVVAVKLVMKKDRLMSRCLYGWCNYPVKLAMENDLKRSSWSLLMKHSRHPNNDYWCRCLLIKTNKLKLLKIKTLQDVV